MNKKVLISGLVGGIIFFLLGWVIYGILLANFMNEQTTMDVSRPENEMIMWALAIGNLSLGVFLAWLFSNMPGVNNPASGFKTAATVGFFTTLMFDMIMYGTTKIFTLQGAVVDILVFTIMAGIGGSIIAMMMNRGEKAAA